MTRSLVEFAIVAPLAFLVGLAVGLRYRRRWRLERVRNGDK